MVLEERVWSQRGVLCYRRGMVPEGVSVPEEGMVLEEVVWS